MDYSGHPAISRGRAGRVAGDQGHHEGLNAAEVTRFRANILIANTKMPRKMIPWGRIGYTFSPIDFCSSGTGNPQNKACEPSVERRILTNI